ncbi:MAG: transcriptional regulator [Planctomycetaceae bacterium]|nr:transcriptional regulator [Planctomycetaceae bacterium]
MASADKVRRLLDLLDRLQSGRAHNTGELADFCGVSRRTVFRDLKTLQDSGVPVLYDSQKQGYWIAAGTFLPPTDLTLSETLSLLIVAQELGDFSRGIPFQESARDAAMKLLSNLPGQLRQHVGEVVETVQIRTEAQPELQGQRRHYEHALQAIERHQKMRLCYGSLAERKEIRTLVSPYRLVFMRRCWYIIGRSSLHRAVRTFHLGRIVESELTDDLYEIPPRFSLKRYLGNAWHLICNRSQRCDVVIRFQPLVATNVSEVSWHATQLLRWNADGTMDFMVTVDGLQEIVWWVLGYGDQAEVLQPPELRSMLQHHVERMAMTYGVLPTTTTDETSPKLPAKRKRKARKTASTRNSKTAKKKSRKKSAKWTGPTSPKKARGSRRKSS